MTTAPPTLTQRATNGVFSLIDPFSFGEVSAHTRLLSGEPQIPLKGILPSEEDVLPRKVLCHGKVKCCAKEKKNDSAALSSLTRNISLEISSHGLQFTSVTK